MDKGDLIKETAKVISVLKSRKAVIDRILSPLDNVFQELDDSEKEKFIGLLDETEEKVKKMKNKNQDWLLSEIYFRKGRCAKGIFEKKKEYHYWKQAYDCALKGKNDEVVVQSGISLGFDFYEFTTSIREISEIHMNCIRAICGLDTAIFTRLRIMGINLFNFWSQIEFRRLSEHDLKVKQLVIDGAKDLQKAGFDEDRAAPVMILLISKAFEFEDPCLEWAQHESAVLDIPIPESIKRKTGSIMLDRGDNHD